MTDQQQKCQACDAPLDTDEPGWGLCQPCYTLLRNSEADIADGRVREVAADEFVNDQKPEPPEGPMTTTPETGRVPSPWPDIVVTVDSHGGQPIGDGDIIPHYRHQSVPVRQYPIGPDGLTEPERQLAATRALLDEAVRAMRMGEWSPSGACSICKRLTWQGHHSACAYAAFLAKVGEAKLGP